jgi:hypothetical protein
VWKQIKTTIVKMQRVGSAIFSADRGVKNNCLADLKFSYAMIIMVIMMGYDYNEFDYDDKEWTVSK